MKGHIRERGPGRWAIVLDLHDAAGRRRKWHTFAGTKREAQKECARLIASMTQGTYVEPSKATVADFVGARVDQWEAAGTITAGTAQCYRRLVKNQIAPYLGAKLLQKLTCSDIEQWHTTLRSEGLTARTTGHAHRILGKALADAERDTLVARNVCKLQRAPKVGQGEMPIVRDVPGLIEKLPRGARLYVPVILALFTGMRLGEILALKEQRIDLDAKVIKVREALEDTKRFGIRFKKPKSAAGERDITLPTIVVEALHEHRRKLMELRMKLGLGKPGRDDLIFPNLKDGGPIHPSTLSAEWAAFANQAGMPEITFHALRHTHASQLIAGGVDLVTISKRLGHSKPNITLAIYAHMFARDDSKAAAAIDAALNSGA